MVVTIDRNASFGGEPGDNGLFDEIQIPDKNDVTRENALFYSNDGRFSFNTVKFKDFKFFKNMKDRIASNWYPPLMANSIVQGYNPLSGEYAPGFTRIMAIPSQEVKMVLRPQQERGHHPHTDTGFPREQAAERVRATTRSRLSKSFGPVPKDLLKDGLLVIPFIFGYYVY